MCEFSVFSLNSHIVVHLDNFLLYSHKRKQHPFPHSFYVNFPKGSDKTLKLLFRVQSLNLRLGL